MTVAPPSAPSTFSLFYLSASLFPTFVHPRVPGFNVGCCGVCVCVRLRGRTVWLTPVSRAKRAGRRSLPGLIRTRTA